MFLVLIEIAVLVFGVVIFVTQVLTPISLGLPLFPALRQTGKIQETIIDKKSELHNESLLDEVDQLDTKIIEKKERRIKK